MKLLGIIERTGNGIDYAEWLRVAEQDPRLTQMTPVHGTNPFTRQHMLYARPYAMNVHVSGTLVGTMIWEADAVLVSGSGAEVLPIAHDIARVLGATFSSASS